jgi:hypothetical protein
MKKLAVIIVWAAITLWAGLAWAQEYSVLDKAPVDSPNFGIGGLMMSGDNALGAGDSEFIPTVNLSGVTDFVAYQVFYGMGSDSTVLGGSLDYILASNSKKLLACPTLGKWWFGAGVSAMDVNDLYAVTDGSAGVDETLLGGNLGFGYTWDRWAFNIYAHMLTESQIGIQAALLYDVSKK